MQFFFIIVKWQIVLLNEPCRNIFDKHGKLIDYMLSVNLRILVI